MAAVADKEQRKVGSVRLGERPLLLLADVDLAGHAALRERLEGLGFQVACARSGPRALAIARADSPAFIVLSPELPGLNGWAVRYALRHEGNRAPILLLARSAEAPVAPAVRGSDLDGYLPKPFSLRQLLTQVEALYRYASGRAATERGSGIVTIGAITLDPNTRRVFRGGEELDLTPKAFDLLKILMQNAGLVVPRRTLVEQVWEVDWEDSARTLDAHVRWLRRVLEPRADRPRYIYTIRGVGYRFAAADEATTPHIASPERRFQQRR